MPFFFDSNLKLRKLSESPRNQSKTSQKKTKKKRKRRRRRRKLKKRRQSNPSLPVSLCWRKSRKKVKARLRKNKKKKKKKQRHKSSHPPSLKSLRDQVCLVLSVLPSRAEELLCSLNLCKLGLHVASLIFGFLRKDDGDGQLSWRIDVLRFKAIVFFFSFTVS